MRFAWNYVILETRQRCNRESNKYVKSTALCTYMFGCKIACHATGSLSDFKDEQLECYDLRRNFLCRTKNCWHAIIHFRIKINTNVLKYQD